MCTADDSKEEKVNGSSIGLDGGMGVAPAMTDQAADSKNSPSDDDTPISEIASPSLSSPANPPFPQLGRRRMKWNRQNKLLSAIPSILLR
jgi:hypothetical protein